MSGVLYFASEASTEGGIFEALGIDWQMLIFQIVAFLLLVWLLGKFVYPTLMRTIDARQEKIQESITSAEQAKKDAEKSQEAIQKLLETARRDAQHIVSTAKDEASIVLAEADTKAAIRAQAIVEAAHTEIAKDIAAARKRLHDEMIDIVAVATSTVLKKKIDSKTDSELIADALKEARK